MTRHSSYHAGITLCGFGLLFFWQSLKAQDTLSGTPVTHGEFKTLQEAINNAIKKKDIEIADINAKLTTVTKALPPIGAVVASAGDGEKPRAEDEWLPCDGRRMSSVGCKGLFKAIGRANGDGSDTPGCDFNLPDYRGMFLRSLSSNKNEDPDAPKRIARKNSNSRNRIGSYESDAPGRHDHSIPVTFPNYTLDISATDQSGY